ncbi:MAG: class I SAM-dependent methyltransferase [Alphaproteobacteria bacterium]
MLMEDLTLWATLLIAGTLVLLVVVPTLRTGAPPMPSSRAVRSGVGEALAQHASEHAPIYDFGSGWGGMARYLARRFPDRKVTGIEASVLPWLVSAAFRWAFGPENLRYVYGDFRKYTLDPPFSVIGYLGPSLSAGLTAAVKSAGDPSCRVISCYFALPDLILIDRRTARDLYRTQIYTYRV